jgi:succinyl-diaminopimelate desuccinylase
MDTLALLQKLVSIPSPFPQEGNVAAFLKTHLRDMGFEVKTVMTGTNRPNLVATFGKSKQYLGFYGHTDTITPDPDYPQNPYTVLIKNDKATGMGVADMKGGLTAILQAGHYAVAHNLPVKLLFGVDEENISEGAHDLVDSGLLNDVNFLIVAESGQAASLKQAYSVCYGRKGRILFALEVSGKKAHAAEAERGINAVVEAAKMVEILESMRFATHARLGKTRIVIHSLVSRTDSFSIPDKAVITFSLLTTPNIKSAGVVQAIKQKAKKSGITITLRSVERVTPYGESYEVDIHHPLLKIFVRQLFKPDAVVPMYATSVADENVFANRLGIPVITLGPVGGGDHTIHEWLSVQSLDQVIKAYQQILHFYHQ